MHSERVTAFRNFGEGLSFSRLPKTFAERFSEVLDSRQRSGRAVSQASGIVESQISDYRRGEVKEPGVFTLLKIARAVGCSVEELVEGIDPEYDALRSDLIRHAQDQQSGPSSNVGDLPNDSTAAGVLESENQRLREALEQVTHVASQLAEIAAAGVKSDQAASGRPGNGNRDRKTG